MSLKYHPVEVSPRTGGKLVTNISAEKAGLHNYVVNRDFRRYIDELRRREGLDYFWPNTTGDYASTPGNQPFPNNVTATTIASITRSSTTATATVTLGHMFVTGETVVVSGATQTEYNVTAVISNVTRTTFDYTVSGSPATPATGSPSVKSAMPINLVHFARRPNGKTAVIVGTATRLFRFFSLDVGGYFEATGTNAPFFETSGVNAPYFSDNATDWIIIGSGYSVIGKRWESVCIDGTSVFNNGVDLPVQYRLEWDEARPVYEMRENGIAAVGSIWEYDGIMMCADISEIIEEKLDEIFLLDGVVDSGAVIASQSGTTVTASGPVFVAGDVNRWIVFDSGESGKISVVTDSRTVTVGTSQTVALGPFKFRKKASLAGGYFSGTIGGTYVNSTQVVSVPSGTTAPTAGQIVRFINGFSSVVLASPSPTATSFKLTDQMGADITEATSFWISDGTPTYADYLVVSDSDIFTDSMVGRLLIWDDGNVRKILERVNATTVRVDSDIAIALGFFGVENPNSYGSFAEPEFIDRIRYRLIWSMPDLPNRFAASVPGSMTAGYRDVTLDRQAKSFEVGQTIIISGAGLLGGNLTGTIITIAANKILTIDTPALTTVENVDVQQSDSIGSIVGFYDVQDDSSAIITGAPLSKSLVVFKETSIILGVYTGDVTNPFAFSDPIRIENGGALYYKHTLCNINSEFLLYAGASSFWRFDLTNQVPRIFESAELCKNIFFDKVTQATTESVFAVNNPLTKEIFFSFPSATSDKMMAFDYLHGEWSTLNFAMGAGASIKRPIAGTANVLTDDWFVMGTSSGSVVMYGLANEDVTAWSSTRAIFYRRSANPYTAVKTGYESRATSGLSAFGTNLFEKKVRSFTVIMSSLSSEVTVSVDIKGTRNPAEATASFTGFPYDMTAPFTQDGLHFDTQGNYFQSDVVVTGVLTPVSISNFIWEAAFVNANSNRRPTA